jgi:hypothetical protein
LGKEREKERERWGEGRERGEGEERRGEERVSEEVGVGSNTGLNNCREFVVALESAYYSF